MNAAIYIRVSTAEQAQEGYSLAAQERLLRKWCEDHGHTVHDIYADEGVSGKDIVHRDEMRRMLQDAEAGAFEIIVFWSLSRFTRSVVDLYDTWGMLQKHGVGIVSLTEGFDASTPMGRAMMGMLGIFAQMEREITAERVVAAMDERARQGYRTSSRVLGYDTADDSLAVNVEEAGNVVYLFAAYEKMQNLTSVSNLAQYSGIVGKNGKPLTAESIHKILTNPIYCGYNVWRGEAIKGDHAPIITPEEFNEVQRMIQERGGSVGRKRKKPLILLEVVQNGAK
jgi:site-specific DNA recombinase